MGHPQNVTLIAPFSIASEIFWKNCLATLSYLLNCPHNQQVFDNLKEAYSLLSGSKAIPFTWPVTFRICFSIFFWFWNMKDWKHRASCGQYNYPQLPRKLTDLLLICYNLAYIFKVDKQIFYLKALTSVLVWIFKACII